MTQGRLRRQAGGAASSRGHRARGGTWRHLPACQAAVPRGRRAQGRPVPGGAGGAGLCVRQSGPRAGCCASSGQACPRGGGGGGRALCEPPWGLLCEFWACLKQVRPEVLNAFSAFRIFSFYDSFGGRAS